MFQFEVFLSDAPLHLDVSSEITLRTEAHQEKTVTSALGYLGWATWGNSCSSPSLKSLASNHHTLRSPVEDQNPQVHKQKGAQKSKIKVKLLS